MRILAALAFVATAWAFVAHPSAHRARPTALSAGLFDNIFKAKSTDTNTSVKKQLDGMMKKKKYGILMISSSAKDSVKAKSLLDEKRTKYKAVVLNEESNAEAIRAEFGVGIWIRGTFVAGFNELNALNKKGELDDLLKNVPKTTYTTPR